MWKVGNWCRFAMVAHEFDYCLFIAVDEGMGNDTLVHLIRGLALKNQKAKWLPAATMDDYSTSGVSNDLSQ